MKEQAKFVNRLCYDLTKEASKAVGEQASRTSEPGHSFRARTTERNLPAKPLVKITITNKLHREAPPVHSLDVSLGGRLPSSAKFGESVLVGIHHWKEPLEDRSVEISKDFFGQGCFQNSM